MTMRKIILCAFVGAAMIPAAASAQRGGGGPPAGTGGPGNAGGFGAGGPGGMGSAIGNAGFGNGGIGNGGLSDVGSMMRDQARMNSQGPTNASPIGIHHANQNSVLSTTPPSTTGLHHSGVTHPTETHVQGVDAHHITTTSAHHAVTSHPTVSHVGVAGSNHARLNSQGPEHASSTGVHHASQNSVLAGAHGASLTNISVGMPLLSNGSHVGTVTRVITAHGVVTRVLVQGMNGRTYSLAPNSLTASGGTLTTTMHLHGV